MEHSKVKKLSAGIDTILLRFFRKCYYRSIISRAGFIIFAVLFAGSQIPLISEDWGIESRKRIYSLKKKNGSGTNRELQKRLMQMLEEDETFRRTMIKTPDNEKDIQLFQEAFDKKLTAELKDIVQKFGWPTIRLVGYEASHAAMRILNHSPDRDFQKEWIPQLQKMVEQDEIAGFELGLIIDKLLRAEGKPQLFGSQFRVEGDFIIMEPVQDPEHLDQRRARYLLPPIMEYIKMLENHYRKKLK
jgi:hypothetical protein